MRISSKFTIGIHLLTVLDYLGDKEKVTSSVLAGSIGANPVIVRNVMGDLKEAGIISVSQGKSGISLAKAPDQITFFDVYRAVDCVDDDGLFRFHDNPNPDCPVGRNIHALLDEKLQAIQQTMENELRGYTLLDLKNGLTGLLAAENNGSGSGE